MMYWWNVHTVVRPGVYIRKVHVDFKSTELWKKHLSDKIVLWFERDSERSRGGERAVIFSAWAAHADISLFILIRMNQVCLPEDNAPVYTHTRA